MTPSVATDEEIPMLHKVLRLIVLNIVVAVVVIAAGHALSYLLG